jgi:carboxylesterase type B
LAIEWIYENAHLFGGDRNRIVLAGHSAGAGNVMLLPGMFMKGSIGRYAFSLGLLASQHCRGMIKRVISQSGTGLAPWSINHRPMKLIERLSREFDCQRSNETEMFQCIYQLLENSQGDFYRLHLSLSIGEYPDVGFACSLSLSLFSS